MVNSRTPRIAPMAGNVMQGKRNKALINMRNSNYSNMQSETEKV